MGDLGDAFRDVKEYQKKVREDKYGRFCSKTLPKLLESKKITSVEKFLDKFIIITNNFGIIDMFPKADRLLIRKNNEWHSGATEWILDNII